MWYIFGMVSETLEAIDSKTVSVFDRHCIKVNLLTNRTQQPGPWKAASPVLVRCSVP